MSADLLAEFGDVDQALGPGTPHATSNSKPEHESNVLLPGFEMLRLSKESQQASFSGPLKSSGSTFDNAMLFDYQRSSNQEQLSRPKIATDSAPVDKDHELWQQDQDGTNVLFDASAESVADDDFGDFESGTDQIVDQALTKDPHVNLQAPTAFSTIEGQQQFISQDGRQPEENSPAKSSLAFSRNDPWQLIPSEPTHFQDDHLQVISDKSSHFQGDPFQPISSEDTHPRGPSKDGSILPHNEKNTRVGSREIQSNPAEFDDDWGDFAEADLKPLPEKRGSQSDVTKNDQSPPLASPRVVPVKGIRPTNIPPPSVLLQLFPAIFEDFYSRTIKQSDVSQSTIIHDLLSTLSACGRIITGRTLRWKRDFLLSQSTRIGPAHCGKPGGMKLTNINKSENLKEQREVADVLDTFSKRSHHFNSLILKSGGGHQPVQLSDHMQVKTLSVGEGAVKAQSPCALCGLKREERVVARFDERVDDTFWEWWSEHWGHVECRRFWERYRDDLVRR